MFVFAEIYDEDGRLNTQSVRAHTHTHTVMKSVEDVVSCDL